MNITPKLWLLIVASLVSCSVVRVRAAEPLKLVSIIPLPGVEGRIDHLAVDVDGKRLFIAALGNNTVEVVDLATGAVAHRIGSLKEPQGVAFLKDSALLVVANGDDGKCRLFSAASFKPLDSFDFQSDADNLRYDPTNQRLYVGYGNGAIGVIDVKSRKRLADIKLPQHPEAFQLESKGPRIFVNVPNARQIAVIDRTASTVVATWPVEKAQSNFPMALDEENRRLFVGCRKSAEVLVYDTDSGKVVSHFPTVGDSDDLFYDSRTKRLYVSGGEGYVIVHQQQDLDQFTQLAKIPTAAGARTALFVPALAHLYLAVPHRGSQSAEIRVYEVVP